MNLYNIIAVLFALFAYVRLVPQLRNGDAEQNLATWISWVLLDIAAASSLFAQGGNWQIILVYVIGGSLITYMIMKYAEFKLGWVEVICFLLVIVCVVEWIRLGPSYTTIFSTTGVAIATYPVIKDAWFAPEKTPMDVFLGFTGANILSTLAGKDWTVEERLYPAVCTALTLVIVGLTARKYFSFYRRPRGAQ